MSNAHPLLPFRNALGWGSGGKRKEALARGEEGWGKGRRGNGRWCEKAPGAKDRRYVFVSDGALME